MYSQKQILVQCAYTIIFHSCQIYMFLFYFYILIKSDRHLYVPSSNCLQNVEAGHYLFELFLWMDDSTPFCAAKEIMDIRGAGRESLTD